MFYPLSSYKKLRATNASPPKLKKPNSRPNLFLAFKILHSLIILNEKNNFLSLIQN